MSRSSKRWPSRQTGARPSQLQSEFLSASLQRATQFAQRYVEVSQAVMSSAQTTARSQTRKA